MHNRARHRMGLALTVVSSLLIAGCKSPADQLVGNWKGTLNIGQALAKPGMTLRIVCTFEKKGKDLAGSIQSPDQSQAKIAFDSVEVKDGTVKFQANPLFSSYEGTLSKDGTEISGNWKQGGVSFPLTLKKSA